MRAAVPATDPSGAGAAPGAGAGASSAPGAGAGAGGSSGAGASSASGGGILDDLESGSVRAASPDPAAPGGWRVHADVKAAIIEVFQDRTTADWSVGPFSFRDRAAFAPRGDLAGGPWRIVPGGTAVRRGVHLADGVIVMPPSYLNVGAWIGSGTMVDSHVLVGSCAQIGARVHLAAGVTIGGVLEPSGARPVIVEDDAFIGAGCALLEGVLVSSGAVIGAGVILTGTSPLYDLVRGRVLQGTAEAPLVVPSNAVVVPGSRALDDPFARVHGLSASTALLVKDRDTGTSARVALESVLR
ncbi:MAG: 2,3,4,5-tetrahydropyridine-2,6-dicarboxylate N-succinyltransferase [Chloroflexota bacterium]